MSSEHIERLNEVQAPLGRLLGLFDFVADEVRLAVTGEPTERQVERAKAELGSVVWSIIGPLLTMPVGPAWTDALNRVDVRQLLRRFDELHPAIGKRMAADGNRELAVARLQRAAGSVEATAEDLQARVIATLQAVDKHVRWHHPRLPKDDVSSALIERVLATLTAVIAAGALERKNQQFSSENVRACEDACLRALQDWGKLYGLRTLPALASDTEHEARQKQAAADFRAKLDAQSAEDDEFGLAGD